MKKLFSLLIFCVLAAACSSHVGVRDSMGDLSVLEPGSQFAVQAQTPDYRLVEPLANNEVQVVSAALTEALNARGLREASAEEADYLVQFTAYQRDRYRIILPDDFWTQEYYVIQTSSMTERRMNPQIGFLHVRIIDLHSGAAVWHGIAEQVAGPSAATTDARLKEGVGLLMAGR